MSACEQSESGRGLEQTRISPIVYDVLRSPGRPLDAATRAFIEPRFGQDFSEVNVHTDGKAAASAQAVHASAYTVGRNVVFAAGQYQMGTNAGHRRLAHELTHVIQQEHPPASAPAALQRDTLAAAQSADPLCGDYVFFIEKIVIEVSSTT